MRKTFSIVLILLLIGIGAVSIKVAFAFDPRPRFFSFNNFSGGKVNYISPYLLNKTQSSEAQDIRFNKTYGAYYKRDSLLEYEDMGSTQIESLYRFYKESDDTEYSIIATSTLLYYKSSSTEVALHEGLTTQQRFQFETYNDNLIAMNGAQQPLKWDGKTSITANTDGHRTASNMMAELGAPYAELNTGDNLAASRWYAYQVTMFNGTANSYSTAQSNCILTGADVRDIYLTNIPIGPSGTTNRYVYRTEGYASKALLQTALAAEALYLCTDIADNTTTVFADTVDDATLDDDAAPTWATVSAGTDITPPIGKYGIIHNERLFIAGNSTTPNDVYFSDPYIIDYFDPGTNYESIRPNSGDKITFLKEQLGILTIGMTNAILKYYTEGTPATDWYTSDVFTHIGCPAPYSAVNTPIGIMYLGRHGIFNFDGQYSKLMSDKIRADMADVSQPNIAECYGAYLNNEFYLAYTSKSSGESNNNRVLVYDIISDNWTEYMLDINCFHVFQGGTDKGVLYAGDSTTDGYIYAFSSDSSQTILNLKSTLDAGTKDDTNSSGTEADPVLNLAWDCTIDGWLTELQTKDADVENYDDILTEDTSACIIDRYDTSGSWESEGLRINANALNKIYWNENLNTYGDITVQVKCATSSAGLAAATYNTAMTDSSGSDISGVTAEDWIMIKVNFTTTDIDYGPTIFKNNGYLIKFDYYQDGTKHETSITSLWQSGWTNFDIDEYKKTIKWIKIFYEGTGGELTVSYKNNEGDVDDSYTIDMSVVPDLSSDDAYFGEGSYKYHIYQPEINSETVPTPIGDRFMFSIMDTGVTPYTIHKVLIHYQVENLYYE